MTKIIVISIFIFISITVHFTPTQAVKGRVLFAFDLNKGNDSNIHKLLNLTKFILENVTDTSTATEYENITFAVQTCNGTNDCPTLPDPRIASKLALNEIPVPADFDKENLTTIEKMAANAVAFTQPPDEFVIIVLMSAANHNSTTIPKETNFKTNETANPNTTLYGLVFCEGCSGTRRFRRSPLNSPANGRTNVNNIPDLNSWAGQLIRGIRSAGGLNPPAAATTTTTPTTSTSTTTTSTTTTSTTTTSTTMSTTTVSAAGKSDEERVEEINGKIKSLGQDVILMGECIICCWVALVIAALAWILSIIILIILICCRRRKRPKKTEKIRKKGVQTAEDELDPAISSKYDEYPEPEDHEKYDDAQQEPSEKSKTKQYSSKTQKTQTHKSQKTQKTTKTQKTKGKSKNVSKLVEKESKSKSKTSKKVSEGPPLDELDEEKPKSVKRTPKEHSKQQEFEREPEPEPEQERRPQESKEKLIREKSKTKSAPPNDQFNQHQFERQVPYDKPKSKSARENSPKERQFNQERPKSYEDRPKEKQSEPKREVKQQEVKQDNEYDNWNEVKASRIKQLEKRASKSKSAVVSAPKQSIKKSEKQIQKSETKAPPREEPAQWEVNEDEKKKKKIAQGLMAAPKDPFYGTLVGDLENLQHDDAPKVKSEAPPPPSKPEDEEVQKAKDDENERLLKLERIRSGAQVNARDPTYATLNNVMDMAEH